MVVGLLIAAGAGLWVRSLFRGAAVQDGVQAAGVAPAPAPAAQPTWTPPVLSYPPMVGYNAGTPSGAATLAMRGAPPEMGVESAGQGMTSIAPPSEPTRKTAFTNDDLERGHATTGAPAAATATAVATSAAAATAHAAAGTTDDATREWVSRVRDDEDKVRDAQAKVRRLQAQVEVLRAQAAALSDAKAQRDLADTLDDLDKAERKLAEKQRDLDDTKEQARGAGVRL
jgi:cell division septum initiation protein DivIVA